jgi:hypothetical protein
LTPREEGKNKYALHQLLCLTKRASNSRDKPGKQNAMDERGNVKVHTISHLMHFFLNSLLEPSVIYLSIPLTSMAAPSCVPFYFNASAFIVVRGTTPGAAGRATARNIAVHRAVLRARCAARRDMCCRRPARCSYAPRRRPLICFALLPPLMCSTPRCPPTMLQLRPSGRWGGGGGVDSSV